MEKSLALFIQPCREDRLGASVRICVEGSKARNLVRRADPFGTLAQYRALLQADAYSAILHGGALLHLSYDFQNDQLVGHSLLYYPCPVFIEPDFADVPILDVLDAYENEPAQYRFRSPIRFDYDPARATMDHPVTHVHFQQDDCRMPVIGPVSIGRFVEFVFQNFHRDLWQEHDYLRKFRCPRSVRTLHSEHNKRAHFAFAID